MSEQNENLEHVKKIAKELEDVAAGKIRKTESGEYVTVEDEADDDLYEDCEVVSMLDFFKDCLDIKYLVNDDKTYNSVQLLVAYGGPNIYVSTITNQVELYWWGDVAKFPLTNEVVKAIDEAFEELYNCL